MDIDKVDVADCVELAKLAEAAERYDDMVMYMKKVAENRVMKNDDRNLFSVAYKNVVGTRRSAWRIVTSLDNKQDADHKLCGEYRSTVEKELEDICQEVVDVLDKHVLPKIDEAGSDLNEDDKEEMKVFFKKMKGDYYRYMAEALTGDKKDECSENAKNAYENASDNKLSEINPVRLGLALNFSVFYYEILKEPDQATKLAQKAFDDAVQSLERSNSDDSNQKDSTLILQLLRDNLTLWTSDGDEEN